MTHRKRYNVPFKRKRLGRTNYKKRLKILLFGKLRLVVRKSLDNIMAQIIEYNPEGDKVILAAHSRELDKLGWKINKGNIPTAYLVGLLLGQKAKRQKIEELVLDLGLNDSIRGCRIYAVLKGLIDAGIRIPHSEEILPSKERTEGIHIVNHAKILRSNKEEYEKRFGGYIKNKIDINEIPNLFEETRKKVVEVGKNG
ncbi:50S ribosomal protein L18 [Candidatus Woesearchaeota archaeon]|nr:50S ribosomal protein L18P [uncultured archaeon]MBS3098189.1 50S ribosomal protein L18 [Candidatus Woesearchaeota archaeon]